MKILQVTPYFKPMWEAGGVARVAYEVSKHLSERGHEVTVYTTNRCLYPTDVVSNVPVDVDGMKVYYFENLRKYFPSMNIPVIPYYLPIVAKKEIKNFDVIHIHDHRSLLAVVVCHYAKKYGVPYIVQAHGSLPNDIGKNRLKNLFDFMWGKGMLDGASKAIAVSNSEVDQYLHCGMGRKKIECIPNGVNISQYSSLPKSGKFRKKYDIHEKNIILYLGRVNERKGLDILIKSFGLLRKDLNDVILVIAGADDRYKSVLERLVKDLNLVESLRFIDYVDNPLTAYGDADLLVYPGKSEIFGLVPFEALLCGTPVVVTDDCGCGEIIREAGCGYLVRYGDVAGLSRTIEYALEHPEENRKMVEKGRRYIEEHLAWERVVKQVEAMYEDCVRHV